MPRDPKIHAFHHARSETIGNLRAIQGSLERCVDEGMVDLLDTEYNEILTLIDEASLSKEWPELMEVIAKAKILEVDIAAWLANHGRTSVSLPWPRSPG